jgi:F1F0 ATPase subunit 2
MGAKRMSGVTSSALESAALAFSLVAPLAAGIGVGIVYFSAIWWTARLVVGGGGGSTIIALMALRIPLLAGVCVLAARHGTQPLLAAVAGLLIGRALVMHSRKNATA